MKWVKHDTDANQDARLQNVLLDYGLEGYGLYWYCIELIAGKVDKENITFELEHDARIIARATGSTAQKVEEMMRYFVRIGLFENTSGVVTCLKLAKRLDKSMTSNPEMRAIIEQLRSENPVQSHDSVMIESEKVMQDKTRLDQIRLDKKKTVPAKADYSAFDNAVIQWNSFASDVGLPTVNKITTNRGRKIDTAYKNYKKLRTELNDGAADPKRVLNKVEFVEALITVAKQQIKDFHINMPITFDYLLDKKRVDKITETGIFQ